MEFTNVVLRPWTQRDFSQRAIRARRHSNFAVAVISHTIRRRHERERKEFASSCSTPAGRTVCTVVPALGNALVFDALFPRWKPALLSVVSTVAACAVHEDERSLQSILSRSEALRERYAFNLNALSDEECLFNFRFRKSDIVNHLIVAFAWPTARSHTRRNRYSVDPLLATCVVLNRLGVVGRLREKALLFGRHGSHLSEIFYEALECLVDSRLELIQGTLETKMLRSRLQSYAAAISREAGPSGVADVALFMDGKLHAIQRPGGGLQRVCYDGHKRRHGLRFQLIVGPDGIQYHMCGPFEARRGDWWLYSQSGVDEQLVPALTVNGTQHIIYTDAGYYRRPGLCPPHCSSAHPAESLCDIARMQDTAMATVRISAEWSFKEISQYFRILTSPTAMSIRKVPVGLLITAASLIQNFRVCLGYPCELTQKFKLKPPSLSEYLAHQD